MNRSRAFGVSSAERGLSPQDVDDVEHAYEEQDEMYCDNVMTEKAGNPVGIADSPHADNEAIGV